MISLVAATFKTLKKSLLSVKWRTVEKLTATAASAIFISIFLGFNVRVLSFNKAFYSRSGHAFSSLITKLCCCLFFVRTVDLVLPTYWEVAEM